MWNILFSSSSLIDVSGYIIILTIIFLLIIGILVNVAIRKRYSSIQRDLQRHRNSSQMFQYPILNRIVRDTQQAVSRHRGEVNLLAIIEKGFHNDLSWLLVGERFVKASTGLMIILGLVGTFYGLTLSIGKLVLLISGDISGITEITQSLTKGLAQALSGMSVAFTTSLFGIVAAILMTLFNVFFNLTDRRNAMVVQIETYLDHLIHSGTEYKKSVDAHGISDHFSRQQMAEIVGSFGQSIDQLHSAVDHFESALQTFSHNTRDFQEFNSHLKDNIQRMSLSFSDLSETLRTRSTQMKSGHRPENG